MRYLFVPLVAFAIGATGCPGDPDCQEGQSSTCVCPSGEGGTRECSSEGTWGTCNCACVPECAGRECGIELACGATCGGCGAEEFCTSMGRCEQDCTDACAGLECGLD